MPASANIILDTRRIKKSNVYPVKLRVVYQSKPRDFQTIFDLSKEDYEKLSAPRLNPKLQEIRDKLKSIQRTAEDFIKDMPVFSFYEFERDYIYNKVWFRKRKLKEPELPLSGDDFDYSAYKKRFPILSEAHPNPNCISVVYQSYIKTLIQEERIGTALSYQQAYNCIKKFKGNVSFADVTVSYLYQFEKWMLNRGCSRTTIGIKLRTLRAIFNEAISNGLIKKEKCYPFGRRRYQIPTGRNVKKALEQGNIASIYYYRSDCANEAKAKDFWLFCYFGNGMNPKDLVYLKNKNIQSDYLVFIRYKTERATRNDPKPITVFITEDMWEIIKRWRNADESPDAFLFPIMVNGLNTLRQYELVTNFTKFINDHMENIRVKLGIDKKITTIVSRHSFSTQLKRSGASTEYIQEALGHTDKKTTENYLDSFDKEVKKEFAGALTAFKKDGIEF
jgi:integrase